LAITPPESPHRNRKPISHQNRPLVVLSNNDGCAIARSDEAKALGINMGAPWFKIRHLEEEAGLVALSANFALYGDMSDRMMSLCAGLGHKQEVYSIDESFVDLSGIRGDLVRRAIAKNAERKPGYKYAKASVMLMDLQPATREQLTLDFDETMPENRVRLMLAMDQLNQRYGRGSLVLGSTGGIGALPVWGMKQERLSSGFTTDWAGLAVAG
jgi:nucleotidyltransferase/DNA polymerase involved in DNA repair